MTKFEQLKVGEKLSETTYYSVVKVGKEKVLLKTDNGSDVVLDRNYVENLLTSAAQYHTEASISKTEMASLFLSSQGVVMTVNFNTQVKEKDALEQLYALYPNKGGKLLSEADFKKKSKEVIASVIVGKERTMVGRHYGSQNEFGRVSFIDMEIEKEADKDYDSRTRQVDPRTINWMIIRGVKYNVK